MAKPKYNVTPEQLFEQAVAQTDYNVTEGGLRLLNSGMKALREADSKTLSSLEIRSLTAMISFVAYNQEVSEETVSAIVAAQFGVNETKDLQSRRYQDAIEFLVDFKVKSAIN